MSTYLTPAPHADHAAEPARRAARFDERGIALQTIIIMVVLLAIAGAVATVLFSRASTETARLEETETTYDYATITNVTLCGTAGGQWGDTVDANGVLATNDNSGDETCFPPAS